MKVPQKLKIELPYEPLLESKSAYNRNVYCGIVYSNQVFDQSPCPSCKENVVHIHRRVLFSPKDEQNHIIYRQMDGTGDHFKKIRQTQKDKCCTISLMCGI
jgi:hypothetical protein